jgi:hypothetical protein
MKRIMIVFAILAVGANSMLVSTSLGDLVDIYKAQIANADCLPNMSCTSMTCKMVVSGGHCYAVGACNGPTALFKTCKSPSTSTCGAIPSSPTTCTGCEAHDCGQVDKGQCASCACDGAGGQQQGSVKMAGCN